MYISIIFPCMCLCVHTVSSTDLRVQCIFNFLSFLAWLFCSSCFFFGVVFRCSWLIPCLMHSSVYVCVFVRVFTCESFCVSRSQGARVPEVVAGEAGLVPQLLLNPVKHKSKFYIWWFVFNQNSWMFGQRDVKCSEVTVWCEILKCKRVF